METKIEQLKALREKAENNGDARLKESLDRKIKLLSNSKTVTK
tara:strand:- start:1076 stop:1204 length:129 start_codon:yes stop_codon:yes gene_type:complete